MLKWQIGEVTVTQVVELTTASLGPYLLPQATPGALSADPWLQPFIDEQSRIILSMHALIIQAHGRTIMVDTCIGNDKERTYPKWNQMQGDFMHNFTQQGFTAPAIDTVLCTHMHVDHVGWNTTLVDGVWQPTFANAAYLFAEDEWAHWRTEVQEYGLVIEDSVQPIFDAGLAQLVPQSYQVSDEVRLEPTPGHTPGHVSVHITSLGEEAVITGDMIHHPCQIAHPNWATTADTDQNAAVQTRDAFLERYADRPVLIIGTHFAGPTAGQIVRDGDAYRLDYRSRPQKPALVASVAGQRCLKGRQ
jgi:glyoxylase-like metal-dependent hydrolase (beta-lactamase superfamily II)